MGGLIGTATPSKDGLIPRELMPISVDTTGSKSLFLLASFSSDDKFIATFVISVNKTQYVQPYSYIVSFSYNPSYGLSNALNTNGKYSKGVTPFYYKQTSSTMLKTVDIRSPKTVISVHFSYSLPMAMQIY